MFIKSPARHFATDQSLLSSYSVTPLFYIIFLL